MDASGLWSFVYSINFQIRQIPATNHHFSCEKSLLIFSSLRSHYHRQGNRKKLILPLKNSSKLWRTWSLALPVRNFLSHLHFFKVGEIMLLKHGKLMLPAGHILDLYHVRLSNAAPFCENYTKFYFDAKHKTFGAIFFKKSALSSQYRTLPYISGICPEQGHFQLKLPLTLIL